jgi:hypothetical protein
MIDKYDIQTLERWLYLAKKYGTDAVRIVHAEGVHEFKVTVIDPQRSMPMTGGKEMQKVPRATLIEIQRHLHESMKEEKEAMDVYERRAKYAESRGFPKVAEVYRHIAGEEKHHLAEYEKMAEIVRETYGFQKVREET